MLERTRPSSGKPGAATASRSAPVKRPTVIAYSVVAFLASVCANLAVSEWVSGSWLYYFFGQVPVVLSVALAAVFTAILVLTRVLTGPQFALWTPAGLGVSASLVLILGVFAQTPSPGGFLPEESWLTISYLALPPLLAALWFEAWETVRLREARAAAAPDEDAAAG